MSMESAVSFIKKLYQDDEFTKQLYRMGAFIGKKGESGEDSEKAQSLSFAAAAKSVGFDFSADEYDAANSEYIKSIGGWKSIKAVMRLVKIGKAVEKENKRK